MKSNNLSGAIPRTIGGMSSLRYFWAYGNDFTGGVPNTVTWLPDLVEFKVDKSVLENSNPRVLNYLRVKLNCITC